LLRLLLLDNKSQYLNELIGYLQSLELKLEIREAPGTTGDKGYDGTIISGGAIPYVNLKEVLRRYRHLLNNSTKPLLAICLGLKIMAHCYGGRVRRMENPEVGLTLVRFSKPYPLSPSRSELLVYQDHVFELFDLPEILENYGSSEKCKIQAVKHRRKPQFGVQFHPERGDGNDGHLILKNFVELCRRVSDGESG